VKGLIIGVNDLSRLAALRRVALVIAAGLAAGCTAPRARELGYRIDHQSRTFPEEESGIRRLSVQGDSAFVLDGRNFLTRLRRADGHRLWRIPVGDPLDDIRGITYLPDDGLVLLLAGGHLIVLSDDTGTLLAKQELGQIASTAPVVFGPVLIYGARNGQLIWHSYQVGYQWRGYQISSSIRLDPLLVDDDVAVIASDGTVMVLDAASGSAMWEKRLLSGVEADPTAGDGLLYIAGLDQYVWALDAQTGRTAWRYLSEAPLVRAPTLIGDRLYQHIPTEGLVCFAASPVNTPGGKVIWTTPRVQGRVIGQHGNRLLLWDAHDERLTVLNAERGAVISTIDLPGVRHLVMSHGDGEDLYAAADDGRVIRLVPR
jgi:outer membrane protein assembly factor BamB